MNEFDVLVFTDDTLSPEEEYQDAMNALEQEYELRDETYYIESLEYNQDVSNDPFEAFLK